MRLIRIALQNRLLADAKKEVWWYTYNINRDNLAHLLPSFAQKLAVPTNFWAKPFKGALSKLPESSEAASPK
jgi:hypothetical protein